MKATLCIPRPAIAMDADHQPKPLDECVQPLPNTTVHSRAVYRLRLRYVTHHLASHYGIGVLLDSEGGVLDGFMLRFLHARVGAWVVTDDPEVCVAALGLAPEEWVKGAVREVKHAD
jgi:hypothetical protein